MKDLLHHLDRIPVTLVVVIAYVTLFVLTSTGAADRQPGELLYDYGLLRPFLVVDGQAWRMVAAAFLHANLLHIGLNTLALISLGPSLELTLGSLRFALLYLVSALGGHVAVCLVYPVHGGVLGGSGALFGMLGAILAVNMRAGRHLFQFLEFQGPRRLVGMVIAYLAIGFFIPVVSNTAHIGGLLAGFLVTFLWLQPGREPTNALRRWRLAMTVLFGVLLFWCVQPPSRWDRLWLQSLQATGAQRDALRRAAAMAYLGLPSATNADTRGLDELGETVRKLR